MLLIEKTWEETFPGELFEVGDLVSHKVVQLRQKDKWTSHTAPEQHVPKDMDEDSIDEEADEDLWLTRTLLPLVRPQLENLLGLRSSRRR